MKKWYKARTVWVNVLVIVIALLTVIQEWLQAGDFSAVGGTALGISTANLFLRFLTTESIR